MKNRDSSSTRVRTQYNLSVTISLLQEQEHFHFLTFIYKGTVFTLHEHKHRYFHSLFN